MEFGVGQKWRHEKEFVCMFDAQREWKVWNCEKWKEPGMQEEKEAETVQITNSLSFVFMPINGFVIAVCSVCTLGVHSLQTQSWSDMNAFGASKK